MKKHTFKLLFISLVYIALLSLAGCQNNNQDDTLQYVIKDDTAIEIIYYEKLSADQSLSHFDTKELSLTGKQLSQYYDFQELISQAEQSNYDYSSIILSVPIGWYEIKFTDEGILNLGLRFRVMENRNVEVELYTIKDKKATSKYTTDFEFNQDIEDFINFLLTNGVENHIPTTQ